jgi:hypothetical protein
MRVVELLTTLDCHLCEEAKAVLLKVRKDIPFTLKETLFSPGDPRHVQFQNDIPVVSIDGIFFCKHRVSERALKDALRRESTS